MNHEDEQRADILLLPELALTGYTCDDLFYQDALHDAVEKNLGKILKFSEDCPRLTTVLGLLPMAFGMGEGSEMMKPMAIAMITGMLISTVVTLLFTPVYYSVLDGFSQRSVEKRAAKRAKKLAAKAGKEETVRVKDQ